jgi:transcriptional regulator with XRE-family HTH domain
MGLNGERLRAVREAKNYTQEDLAHFLDVTQQQIWRWESGATEPNGDFISRLAKTLEVTADYLLGLSDDPYPRRREEDLTPVEQRLLAALREGRIVEALEAITTLSKTKK